VTRRRGLTRDEALLWAKVAESVTPLRGRKPFEPPPLPEEPVKPGPTLKAKPPPSPLVKRTLTPPAPPSFEPFDDRLRQRLGRGRAEIDARIDLHGLRQDEAHRTLRAFLAAEQARGSRVVLVITGKGRSPSADPFAEAGVLRRQVPHWMGAADIRPLIVSYDEAGRGHGGEGAFYVRLRRRTRI
jgi:DNA-nicking Smr family endonuclease